MIGNDIICAQCGGRYGEYRGGIRCSACMATFTERKEAKPSEGEWIPMEKAPRDGTVVKVLWDYKGETKENIAFWESGEWWQPDSGHGQAFSNVFGFKYLSTPAPSVKALVDAVSDLLDVCMPTRDTNELLVQGDFNCGCSKCEDPMDESPHEDDHELSIKNVFGKVSKALHAHRNTNLAGKKS